jgi:hypothetical protein
MRGALKEFSPHFASYALIPGRQWVQLQFLGGFFNVR